MMIQNIRLACESMGLGHWNYCGFVPEVILGAYPDLTPGLQATFAPLNERAPIATGAVQCNGWPGKWETTWVPSQKYPDAKSLVDQWYDEKYGDGAWGAEGENNSLRQGQSPWKDPATVEGILAHPKAKPQTVGAGGRAGPHRVLRRELRPVPGDVTTRSRCTSASWSTTSTPTSTTSTTRTATSPTATATTKHDWH